MVCTCVHVCVYLHVEARDQCHVSSIILYLNFEAGSLTEPAWS